MLYPLRLFLFLLLMLPYILSGVARAQEQIALPDIGQSGGAIVTPSEERQAGEAVVRNIRRAGGILDDPLVNDYLNNLGYRLVSTSDAQHPQFEFFMINDRVINAFALPGGFIGVNYGLILATDSESELASVLAHEISHVTQRHHARAYEFSKGSNIPVLAAMIAAMILGSQGSQVGQAALTALSAGSIQNQINFTRANEKEADYIGIQLLADSGFDPNSMAEFFQKLDRESRLYGPQAPEFLRTHPVNESRIADASNRAAHMHRASSPNHKNYYLMRARLQVITASDKKTIRDGFAKSLKSERYLDRDAEQYGYALSLIETGEFDKARPLLNELLKQDPNRIAYLLARARLESMANHHKQAIAYFKQALANYPGNGPLTLAYAHALLRSDMPKEARQLIIDYQRNKPNEPDFYKLLAEAEAALGNNAKTHIAMGEYYYGIGQTHQAIDQLTLALKDKQLDFYNASRVEARLSEFQEEVALLQQGTK
ncbi:MAG: M48 family metalloprotease [Thiohalomonadales bacterium]|nr:M48 family metalloprotease [Thiohalomonadales bacterium]